MLIYDHTWEMLSIYMHVKEAGILVIVQKYLPYFPCMPSSSVVEEPYMFIYLTCPIRIYSAVLHITYSASLPQTSHYTEKDQAT